MPPWISARKDGVSISLRVKPGARRTLIRDRSGEALVLDVAAPPVEGAANDEVIAFIAKTLGVAKARCELLLGHRSRQKVLFVQGVDPAAAYQALGLES